MNAVTRVCNVARVAWKLRSVLADRKITNKALADKLGVHPTSVSRLKTQETLPAIGDKEIEKIRVAINELSQDRFGSCLLSELIRIEEDQ